MESHCRREIRTKVVLQRSFLPLPQPAEHPPPFAMAAVLHPMGRVDVMAAGRQSCSWL